jgi:multisubunit Na+/H+ antiporter MnhF subunit
MEANLKNLLVELMYGVYVVTTLVIGLLLVCEGEASLDWPMVVIGLIWLILSAIGSYSFSKFLTAESR